MNRLRSCALLSLAALTFLCALPATAQLPIEPAKLPARTTFYAAWRGMPSGDVRKSNSIFALWDDPALAPTRAAFVKDLLEKGRKNNSSAASQLNPADLDQFTSF